MSAFGTVQQLTQQCDCSRIGRTFEYTQESSESVDLLYVRGHCDQAGQDSPSDLEARKPEVRAEVCDGDLGRDQEDAVCVAECQSLWNGHRKRDLQPTEK
jgi:hypothetical protein